MTLEEARNRMQEFADKHNMYLAHYENGSCFGYFERPIAERHMFLVPEPGQIRMFKFDVVPFNDDDWRTVISPRPKKKKDTPLQRALDKYGRRLVVKGYCDVTKCGDCQLKEPCTRSGFNLKFASPEIVNEAYEILTKECPE